MEIRCPNCGRTLTNDAPRGMCAACLLSAALDGNGGAIDINPFLSPTTPGVKPFEPLTIETLQPLFPGLELISLLGFGGMGAVYKARQTKLDRFVALKIIRADVASDPSFAERFNREARTMARLSHPGIVAIHDFGERVLSPGESASEVRSQVPIYYIVMEFVDGTNLRQLISHEGLSSERSLSIVPQLCDALQYAHNEGVVHRDIKPENILLDQRGRVKIADFGLAKLVAANNDFTLTGTHQVMGTPRYMAPEQMEGSRAVDHRADIYSVGVVFYEMLTGQVPAGHFDPPSHKVNIDPRLDSLVLKAMARDPERRFQAAMDLRTEVGRITSDPQSQDISPSPSGKSTPASSEPERQALSEFLSYETRAVCDWVAGRDQTSRVPVSVRWVAPILAIGCFACLFFPCLTVKLTEPTMQLVSSPLQVPADFVAGILAGVCLLGAFVMDLLLLNHGNPSRRLAISRVSLIAASVLLLLLFRLSIGMEVVRVSFETGGASTMPVPLLDYQIRGNSGSGRAFLSSLRKTTELTPYGIVVAGSMLSLLVLSVISLKSSVVTSVPVRGVQKTRENVERSPRELAARLMIMMGVIMLVVGGLGFFVGMSTQVQVTSDAELTTVSYRGVFLAGAMFLNIVFGTIAIAGGLSLLRGTSVAFARLICIACVLFCNFSILTTWPLAIWSLFVLNRIKSIESGNLSLSGLPGSSAKAGAEENLRIASHVSPMRALEVILIVVFVVILLLVLSFSRTSFDLYGSFGGITSSYDAVAFGSPEPWLEFHRSRDVQPSFGFTIRWFSIPMWLMLAAVVDYWIYWQMQKRKPGFRPDQILSPKFVFVAIVCIMMTVVATGCSTLLRQQSGNAFANEQASELIAEIQNGDTRSVLKILENRIDPNVFVEGQGTALFWAVMNGDPLIIETLLNQGANPDLGNPFKVTPLMVASLKGDLPTVDALVSSGANLNLQDGVSGEFRISTQTGAINWPGQQMTALMLAISGRYRDVVYRLLEAGADSSVRDREGRDALTLAEQFGFAEIVDMLKARAIPQQEKQPDNSEFERFQRISRLDDLLRQAIDTNDLTMVREWFNSGGRVDGVNVHGELPLYQAIKAGREQIVAMLMLRGADEGRVDLEGRSALMLAVAFQQPQVVRMLLDMEMLSHDAELQKRMIQIDQELTTDTDFSQYQFKAGLDQRDTSGATPAMQAAAIGSVEIFRMLALQDSCDETNFEGRSWFTYAIANRQEELLSQLLDDAIREFDGLPLGYLPKSRITPALLAKADARGILPLQEASAQGLSGVVAKTTEYLEKLIAHCDRHIAQSPEMSDQSRIERRQCLRALGRDDESPSSR